ncbi:unnamed protein product [Gongylonema pulchrum]|uniref:Adenylate kinase n=1 Tax=Gongylonema pulchrum TaxID=637853 RepID=A0A183E397_9BILA|nr:unnamed protein product [Gongylonema pulchrum]
MLQKSLGLKHLSAGDLLRAERKRPGSEFGQLIENHIRNGTIVPAMNASLSSKAFLIDGFPRNQDNLEGWEREMASKAKVLFVLYLHCPEEICVRRCLNRNEGRSDDNEESLRKRIKTYCTQTLPIVEHYRTQDLVREVSACGAPEEVSVSGIPKFI